MWIMVLFIGFSGFASGVKVDELYGFHTKKACEEAAVRIVAVYPGKKDKIKTVCIPQIEGLITNE